MNVNTLMFQRKCTVVRKKENWNWSLSIYVRRNVVVYIYHRTALLPVLLPVLRRYTIYHMFHDRHFGLALAWRLHVVLPLTSCLSNVSMSEMCASCERGADGP
jgi:hypothetical protein